MGRLIQGKIQAGLAIAAVVAGGITGAWAQQNYTISRASLASSAAFTITRTVAPKGGAKESTVYQVEVSGQKARMEYKDANLGNVQYIVNEKGVFFYTPTSKTAVKQQMKGGIDTALKAAFAQVTEQMKKAKKVGTATVSGQPTDVYKDAADGATLYIGKNPGFRLPVKTVLTNVGGTNTLLVSNIRLNVKFPATRFALPPGAKVMSGEATGAPGGGGIGGL